MPNLTIFTVNFNTPEFIYSLVSSYRKYNQWCNEKIHVIDNGTTKDILQGEYPDFYLEYFDNTLYADIEKYSKTSKEKTLASAHHAFTIDWFIKQRVTTDYLLLVDSDIIFTRSFESDFMDFVEHDYGLYGFERTTYKCHCIAPWACFINVKKMKDLSINYFDVNRILHINNNHTHDTGASLFEDFISNNIKIKSTQDNTFYIHLKGGSLDKKKRMKFLNTYRNVYSMK